MNHPHQIKCPWETIPSQGGESRKVVTDKLRGYGVVHRELIPEAIHSTQQYENNRAEQWVCLRKLSRAWITS